MLARIALVVGVSIVTGIEAKKLQQPSACKWKQGRPAQSTFGPPTQLLPAQSTLGPTQLLPTLYHLPFHRLFLSSVPAPFLQLIPAWASYGIWKQSRSRAVPRCVCRATRCSWRLAPVIVSLSAWVLSQRLWQQAPLSALLRIFEITRRQQSATWKSFHGLASTTKSSLTSCARSEQISKTSCTIR